MQAIFDRDLTHDGDESAGGIASRAAIAREALRAVPDILVHLLVDQLDIFAGHRLGDFTRAEIIEAGGGTGSHADTALITPFEVVMKADIFGDLGEELLFLFIRYFSVFMRNLGQWSTSKWAGRDPIYRVPKALERDYCISLQRHIVKCGAADHFHTIDQILVT